MKRRVLIALLFLGLLLLAAIGLLVRLMPLHDSGFPK